MVEKVKYESLRPRDTLRPERLVENVVVAPETACDVPLDQLVLLQAIKNSDATNYIAVPE